MSTPKLDVIATPIDVGNQYMSHVQFEKVAFGYTQLLFQNVSFTINGRDRIGIIGNNGSGKSTLLQCIAGIIEPQAGRITSPKGLKFGFIEQDIPKQLYDMSLCEVMHDAIPNYDKNHMAWKVDLTLDIFKAPALIRKKSIRELSGGWQRLALLARVVLSNPDILLLDEPTNHLDVAKIMVLEQWLNEQVNDIPMISISHDRNFLATCTNKTFFLRGTEVREYRYSYEQAKFLLKEDDEALAARRSKEIKEMNRLKRSAHELRQIGVNNYSASALKKSVQIAKRAEGIETQLTHVHNEEKRAIKLSNSGIQAKKLVEITNLDISAPDKTLLFHIHQLDIMQGDRLIVFGLNGSGKSQFLNHLYQANKTREDAKLNGIIITPTVKLAYIDQHLSHLPLAMNIHDYFNHELSLGDQKTTTALVNAGFPMSMHRTILTSLSHGQRTRIAFLMLHLMQPNFYVMDEPTNHLDIAGQEQLETEILEQGASSIIVSHDRVFTQAIGTKFYVIENKKLQQIDSPELYYKQVLKE